MGEDLIVAGVFTAAAIMARTPPGALGHGEKAFMNAHQKRFEVGGLRMGWTPAQRRRALEVEDWVPIE